MPIDYSKYPPNWPVIRMRIRVRAKERCEWCSARNGQPHPVTGSRVVLTVAHKDHDITHNDGLDADPNAPLLPEPESNLAALCQRCHITWDKAGRRPEGVKG